MHYGWRILHYRVSLAVASRKGLIMKIFRCSLLVNQIIVFAFASVFIVGCSKDNNNPAASDQGSLTDSSVQPQLISTTPADNSIGPFNLFQPGNGSQKPYFVLQFNKLMDPSSIKPGSITCTGFDRPVQVDVFSSYYIYLDKTQYFSETLELNIVDSLTSSAVPYEIGKKYTVTIHPGLVDINGNKTTESYSFSFIPEPYFRVTEINPANGTTEVNPLYQSINIFFNTSISSNIVANIHLSPAVNGQWAFYDYNPSEVYFSSANPLPFSTQFSITIDQTAQDAKGNKLQNPFEASFTTAEFKVLTSTPAPGDTGVALYGDISFQMSGNLDTSSIRSAYSISPALNCNLYSGGNYFEFISQNGFAPTTTYTVTLSTSLRASDGTHLASPYIFTFKTQPFIIQSTSPGNGQTGVSRGTYIYVYGDSYLDTSTIQKSFSINPSVAGTFSTYPQSDYFEFTPSSLNPNTSYIVTISESLKSVSGASLNSPYTFSFTTGQ
jgi:Bacterial Ig-like domain